jgi:hypothetical protein
MGAMNSKEKIIEYFKKNLKKGYTEESLKWALIKQGYSRIIVENAVLQMHRDLAKQAPVLKEKPKITYEVIDENNELITLKKPWWKRFFS